MGIPAQAFVEINPNELASGQLYLFRGFWSLRVSIEADIEGFLILDGDRAGSVYQMAPGMAKVVAIVSPFIWYPMLSEGAKPEVADDPILTLALTAKGPQIVGLDTRDKWDRGYLAVAPSGHGVEMQEVRRAPHFTQWSVEISHPDRPYMSLGTLVKIDRCQKA